MSSQPWARGFNPFRIGKSKQKQTKLTKESRVFELAGLLAKMNLNFPENGALGEQRTPEIHPPGEMSIHANTLTRAAQFCYVNEPR